MKHLVLFLLSVAVRTACLAQITVSGQVLNERGETVEYVSIGIEGDSVGVISDAKGHFTLTIPTDRRDELAVSHVSYQMVTVPYEAYSAGKELTVTLQDKVVELMEVVVGDERKARTLSGKSVVPFSVVGFVGEHDGDIEWGPLFRNRKDYMLTEILLDVSECTYDECMLSFNVYEVRDKQFENILNKPIYKLVTPDDNGKQIAVSPEEAVVLHRKKDYCVSVCLVDAKGKGGLYSPLNLKNSYARNNAKGKMRKLPACPSLVVKGEEILDTSH